MATTADIGAYYAWRRTNAHLCVQAHDLCCALCEKLKWRLEDDRRAKIERVLARARARLERRETARWENNHA
jgi:hypothetical protein